MRASSLCLFLLLFVFSPFSAAGADGARLERIAKAGEIRIGLTGDYRPFSALDEKAGEFSGLDVDLGRSLAGALGVRPVFVATSWPTLSADLEADKFDIAMGGISVTQARSKIGLFSEPVLSDGKTPITRCANVARFQTLEQIDRKGVRLVVNPGGTNEKFARAHIHAATIVMHPNNVTIFQEIVAGRADLMITDAIETRLQAKLHPQLCAVHPDAPFDRAEKAYFMPRDAALKARVDGWLEGLKASGELERRIGAWVE
jgi:cyclohexadienyl dehydratase